MLNSEINARWPRVFVGLLTLMLLSAADAKSLHGEATQPRQIDVVIALDAARATNGKLYILGWQKKQEDTSSQPSVKKVVLLAPGYHPLNSKSVFTEIAQQ